MTSMHILITVGEIWLIGTLLLFAIFLGRWQ